MGGPPPPVSREEFDQRYPERASQRRGFAAPGYWTTERRAEQSERARRLVQEGRFGGRQHNHGGPPRVKKAHEILAEKAIEHAEEMERRLLSMLRSRKDTDALAAIQQYLKVEEMAGKTAKDEEERLIARLTGADLDDYLLQQLAGFLTEGDAVDGDAVEDADEVDDDEVLALRRPDYDEDPR